MNEYQKLTDELIKTGDYEDEVNSALIFLFYKDGLIEVEEKILDEIIEKAKKWFGEEFVEEKLKEQIKDEEEGDWKDFEPYVKEGDEGEFVIQEHERGLTENQAKSGRRYIGEENIHTDIRFKFENNDFLIGFTLSTPGTPDKKNKLLTGEKALVVGIKKRQPIAWLDVGKGKDLFKAGVVEMKLYGNEYKADLSPPGAVGSTSNTWSRFVAIDSGKVKALRQEEHYKEFQLKGKIFDGILKLQGAPLEKGQSVIGDRVWFCSFEFKKE